jgi:hypothetical protein
MPSVYRGFEREDGLGIVEGGVAKLTGFLSAVSNAVGSRA